MIQHFKCSVNTLWEMVYVHIHVFQNKQIGKKITKMETEMIFSSGGLPPPPYFHIVSISIFTVNTL